MTPEAAQRENRVSGVLLIPAFLELLHRRGLILETFRRELSGAPPGDGFQGRTGQKWDLYEVAGDK